MDLLQTIEQIQNEYKSLVNTFSVVDDNDPISPSKLKELLSYLQNWVTNLKNSVVTINFELNNDTIQTDELKKYFERDLLLFNKNLQQSLDILTNTRKRKNNEYIELLNEEKEKTENNINRFEVDKEYFFMTSDQNRMLLNKDFEEDKKRYDYQKSEAKESYYNIVDRYNKSLANIKENLQKDYQEKCDTFNKDNNELIQKLSKLIENKNKELNSLNNLLNNERTSMKERNHNESTILNNNIKKISNEKNIQVDKARSQYSKALSDASIEKENKRQDYLSQSQSLLKDFVTKINEIDDTIQKTKDELELKTYEIKRNYFYSIHQETTSYHKLVEQLHTKHPNGLSRHDQKLIRVKAKSCNKTTANLKKSTEKLLYDLTYDYTKTIEENKHNKIYLEIDKNYAIKKLTELEQYDNKYYQEKNNIYESDNSYVVQTANYRFSQKANVLRCQSQKRYKLLERNFNSIEANYYKKIETVQNKINFHNLEIQLANQLKDIVSEYNQKNYLNDLHYEEVINLLEIEKNKLLNQFNNDKYNLNIQSIKQSLDYGNNRINIQNQKQDKLTSLNSDLERLQLELKNITTSINIEHNDILNKYDKLETQLKYNEEQRKSKFQYQYSLYFTDIQTISKLNEFYIELLSKLQTGHQKLVQILFTNIELNNNNVVYLSKAYNSFYVCFINSYIKIIECYQLKINKILDDRLKFIEEFKYKSAYESLDINFQKQQNNINERLNLLSDQIDSYKKTIENFQNKKFTLENDIEMIRGPHKRKKKNQHTESDNIINITQTKIDEYTKKINDFNKMIQINNEDLEKLKEKFNFNKLNFEKEKDNILRNQQIDSKYFELYKKHIAAMICNYSTIVRQKIEKFSINNANKKSFNTKIIESQNNFYKILAQNKQSINSIHDKFTENIKNEMNYNEAILKDELDRFNQAYEKQKQKALLSHEKNSDKKLALANNKIANHNKLIKDTIDSFDKELLKANESYQKDGIALKKVAEKINNSFFLSYYALNDNYVEINNYHLKQKKDIQDKFDKLKNQSINWSINQKNHLTTKLESLIKSKNEEIERLPLAYKFNTNLYNKETKRKNQEINDSIKLAKQEFNLERKRIEKQLSILKQQYLQTKISTEIQQEKALKAEKKKDKMQLVQSLKAIKVSLESN